MIKNYLQEHDLKSFKNSLRDKNNIIEFKLEFNVARELFILASNTTEEGIRGYNLDWVDGGKPKIKLPATAPAANLFITPTLRGCCIGVRTGAQEITVWHRNFGESHPNQMPNDNNYNKPDFWLLPQGCSGAAGVAKPVYHYTPETVFWGEFEQEKWHFYYYENNTGKIYEVSAEGATEVPDEPKGCCNVI